MKDVVEKKTKKEKSINHHRFFKDSNNGQCNQTVNVNVIVNEKDDDGVTGCFKKMFGCCFSLAKQGASSA